MSGSEKGDGGSGAFASPRELRRSRAGFKGAKNRIFKSLERSLTSRIQRGASSSPSSVSSGVTFGAATSYFSDGTSNLKSTPPLGDARDLRPPPGVVAPARASSESSGSSAFATWALPIVRGGWGAR